MVCHNVANDEIEQCVSVLSIWTTYATVCSDIAQHVRELGFDVVTEWREHGNYPTQRIHYRELGISM